MFLIKQYLVLQHIVMYAFETGIAFPPNLKTIKVRFVSRDNVLRHCTMLRRMRYIEIDTDEAIYTTTEGIHYFFELRRSIVSGILSCIGSLIMFFLGYFLGSK